jgi:hypothetical protein
MSETLAPPGENQAAPPQLLACRLRRKEVVGRRGPVANMGEVELENLSAAPLEIAYRMTALQYLNLVVTGPDGTVVSEGHFGDRFAPTREPLVLHLEPGQKFTANVHLFATVPNHPLPPARIPSRRPTNITAGAPFPLQCR